MATFIDVTGSKNVLEGSYVNLGNHTVSAFILGGGREVGCYPAKKFKMKLWTTKEPEFPQCS